MESWKFWASIVGFCLFLVYLRGVNHWAEKIQDKRKRGLVQVVFLGIPFGILAGLAVYNWEDILAHLKIAFG